MSPPYEDDSAFERLAVDMAQRKIESRKHVDLEIRADLKEKFKVPPEFMDLAVAIWWAGKED